MEKTQTWDIKPCESSYRFTLLHFDQRARTYKTIYLITSRN